MDRHYWKRHFDEERRIKREQNKPIHRPVVNYEKFDYLKRKSKTQEEVKTDSLRSELITYKELLRKEYENRDRLLMEVHKEKQKAHSYYVQLQKIIKYLEVNGHIKRTDL